ncbi:MAG: cobalt transporter [Calothrix sp. MO_167.B12]|nr:cobalt transporter [Calothrix sp. MO_167.B12]
MKAVQVVGSILAVGLAVATPSVVQAHAGHGDEFKAEGGIERVPVKAETDQILGIAVKPIAPASDGSSTVKIPVTALVEADGKQLVFVKYKNFYEPVKVTTGATKGELIEVTKGLTVGEKLVTQGGLSLYAESRKAKSGEESSTGTVADSKAEGTNTQVGDTQKVTSNSGSVSNVTESAKLPVGLFAAIGGGVVLLIGGIGATTFTKSKGESKG